jgi:hypothetical protein
MHNWNWKAIWAICWSVILFLVGFIMLRDLQSVHAQAIPWPKPPYPPVNVSFSSTSTQTLIAAPSAGGVCVYAMSLENAGASAATVSIYHDGGTTAVATVYLASGGGAAGWDLRDNPQNPWFLTNAATGFAVKSSAATQINGSVYAATCP